ncbi:MAG: hypothetical protein J3R72DRAFT_492634 [Linnemannia gamsii]|nr:MAG: hypothetical protein J3R72DRAFT_492634 [Linnemannia gamsii]
MIVTDTTPQPVHGTYINYNLTSTSRDVLHHIMRFHGQKVVTPPSFIPPVKLYHKKDENSHREYYGKRSQHNSQHQQQQATANTKDGDKEGEAAAAAGTAARGTATTGATPGTAPTATGADTTLIAPCGGGVRNKQTLPKKQTRQINILTRKIARRRRLSRHPEDGFKVIPADKWYKFNCKRGCATLAAEEAEEQLNTNGSSDPETYYVGYLAGFVRFLAQFIGLTSSEVTEIVR